MDPDLAVSRLFEKIEFFLQYRIWVIFGGLDPDLVGSRLFEKYEKKFAVSDPSYFWRVGSGSGRIQTVKENRTLLAVPHPGYFSWVGSGSESESGVFSELSSDLVLYPIYFRKLDPYPCKIQPDPHL